MNAYKVFHKVFGEGLTTDIDSDYITVIFGTETKRFQIKGFDKFFEIFDEELNKIVELRNIKEQEKLSKQTSPNKTNDVHDNHTPNKANTPVHFSRYSTSSNALLGPRSQTINIRSMEEMFEVVGYLAHPGRVSSFEAEVPRDGRDDLFECIFPGQIYRPIELDETPSGMPNKVSPQFRINFSSIKNCPQILKTNMGAGTGKCVARINKSRFVIELVEKYGFKFGRVQDYAAIRKIAEEKGYIKDFERGYSL